MTLRLSIPSGTGTLVNRGDPIDAATLGVENLGWEFFSNFTHRYEAGGFEHIRWPGGIPVEAGIDVTGDGERDVVFDMTSDNLLDWRRWADDDDSLDGVPTGKAREGFREMLAYANENAQSLSIILPTAPYVEAAIEGGSLADTLATARSDAAIFGARLVEGFFGPLDISLTLEIGTEYYATNAWVNYNGDPSDNRDGTSRTTDIDLPAYFGEVFAAIVDGVEAGMGSVAGPDRLNSDDDVNIAVQGARFHSGVDAHHFNGSMDDNRDFIDAMVRNGSIDHVDAVIWHRYAHTYDVIAKGLWLPSAGNTLSDMMDEWDRATGKDLDLVAGWGSPTAQLVDSPEFGAVGLTNIMQLYSGLIEAGMDEGTVFAYGLNTTGTLADGTVSYIGGQLYEMMAESVVGKFLHGSFRDNTAPTVNGQLVQDGSVNQYVFEDDQEIVAYVFAKDIPGSQNIAIRFADKIASVEVTRLFDAGGLDDITSGHIGVVGEVVQENWHNVTTSGDASVLHLAFRNDYEVIRVTAQKAETGITTTPVQSYDADPTSAGGTGASRVAQSPGVQVSEVASSMAASRGAAATGDPVTSSGASIIMGTSSDDMLVGGAEEDFIDGGAGADVIQGLGGDDQLLGGVGADTIRGKGGTDEILGGGGADKLLSGAADDLLRGLGGSDMLKGGSGDDKLLGARGRDRLIGHGGDDTADGGVGHDVLVGGGGSDRLLGSGGHDKLKGGGGQDVLLGEFGKDRLAGGAGNDTINGGLGHDTILGNGGQDRLIGSGGNDRLAGGVGHDVLIGESGRDLLFGGGGNDRLDGGLGNDRLVGGGGSDTFIFNGGRDRIKDFGPGDSLSLDIDRTLPDWSAKVAYLEDAMSIRGGSMLLDFGRDGSLLLSGVTDGDLVLDNFWLA